MKNGGPGFWFKTKYGQLCLALIIAGASFLIFSHISLIFSYVASFFGFFSSVIMAFVVAYALDPFCTFYEEKIFGKMRNGLAARAAAVVMTVVIALASLVLLLVSVIPQIIESVKTLTTNARRYVYLINLQIDKLDIIARDYDLDLTQFSETLENTLWDGISELSKSSSSIVGTGFSIGAGVYHLVIIFIISIYVLADKKRLLAGFKKLALLIFPEKLCHSSGVFWSHCNRILIRFIMFDLLDGLIVGIINYFFMIAMRMPYSILVSVVVAITNLAPTFGPVVGGVIGAVILAFVNPWYAVWFIIFTVVLQTFDGYMIKPKLFGDSLGVPALMILISIILCGKLMGVWGVLLGIPIAAILDYIYHDYILIRLEKRKEEKEGKRLAAEEAQRGIPEEGVPAAEILSGTSEEGVTAAETIIGTPEEGAPVTETIIGTPEEGVPAAEDTDTADPGTARSVSGETVEEKPDEHVPAAEEAGGDAGG